MKKYLLEEMVKGWFVGDFSPTAFKTRDFEVAVKKYRAGECEAEHYHVQAIELTVVVAGKVKMCNRIFEKDDIVLLDKGEKTAFEAIEDSVTVVVKAPSVRGDKFVVS